MQNQKQHSLLLSEINIHVNSISRISIVLFSNFLWGGGMSKNIWAINSLLHKRKFIRCLFHISTYDHTNLFQKIITFKNQEYNIFCIFAFKSLLIYSNATTNELLSHKLNSRKPNDLRIPYCDFLVILFFFDINLYHHF